MTLEEELYFEKVAFVGELAKTVLKSGFLKTLRGSENKAVKGIGDAVFNVARKKRMKMRGNVDYGSKTHRFFSGDKDIMDRGGREHFTRMAAKGRKSGVDNVEDHVKRVAEDAAKKKYDRSLKGRSILAAKGAGATLGIGGVVGGYQLTSGAPKNKMLNDPRYRI